MYKAVGENRPSEDKRDEMAVPNFERSDLVIHGLLGKHLLSLLINFLFLINFSGQTLYNRVYKYKEDNLKHIEGDVADYAVSDLFADDFLFNMYNSKK